MNGRGLCRLASARQLQEGLEAEPDSLSPYHVLSFSLTMQALVGTACNVVFRAFTGRDAFAL